MDALAGTGLAEGASAAERESWTEVCEQSLVMLRSVCLTHPNQRKVYVSVLERLFIPLLPYCGPQGTAPVNSSLQSEWQNMACARKVAPWRACS